MKTARQHGGITRLKNRSQFLAVARGQKIHTRGFVLQAATRRPASGTQNPAPRSDLPNLGDPGLGFTVTKRCGNAPARNRIKRRLRAAAGLVDKFAPANDYVLIGRTGTLHVPFGSLVRELDQALLRVHGQLDKKHYSAKQRTVSA